MEFAVVHSAVEQSTAVFVTFAEELIAFEDSAVATIVGINSVSHYSVGELIDTQLVGVAENFAIVPVHSADFALQTAVIDFAFAQKDSVAGPYAWLVEIVG